MPSLTINPVLYLQMQIANLYRKRHNLAIQEFLDLDRKLNILGYIELCYEPFHLTGEEGILDEVDDYCNERLSQSQQIYPRIPN